MLRNYNNYAMDHANRRAAQAAQNNWQHHAQNQQRAINRVKGDYLKSGLGDPDRQSWMNYHIAGAAHPHGEQMENFHNQRMQAMQNYMDNEMAQVQDRKMDLADNEQGRKNLDTEYNRQIEMEKLAAAERMNERNNQGLDSLSNSFSGIADGLISDPMQVPNYDLYDNGKNRIGGSYFGNALLG